LLATILEMPLTFLSKPKPKLYFFSSRHLVSRTTLMLCVFLRHQYWISNKAGEVVVVNSI